MCGEDMRDVERRFVQGFVTTCHIYCPKGMWSLAFATVG
jgi:hypothetical protein